MQTSLSAFDFAERWHFQLSRHCPAAPPAVPLTRCPTACAGAGANMLNSRTQSPPVKSCCHHSFNILLKVFWNLYSFLLRRSQWKCRCGKHDPEDASRHLTHMPAISTAIKGDLNAMRYLEGIDWGSLRKLQQIFCYIEYCISLEDRIRDSWLDPK